MNVTKKKTKLTILPRATQTDRFTILVGPNKSAYEVPEGLLIMRSIVFERMCSAPFLESTQRVINLPEEPEILIIFSTGYIRSGRMLVSGTGPKRYFTSPSLQRNTWSAT